MHALTPNYTLKCIACDGPGDSLGRVVLKSAREFFLFSDAEAVLAESLCEVFFKVPDATYLSCDVIFQGDDLLIKRRLADALIRNGPDRNYFMVKPAVITVKDSSTCSTEFVWIYATVVVPISEYVTGLCQTSIRGEKLWICDQEASTLFANAVGAKLMEIAL